MNKERHLLYIESNIKRITAEIAAYPNSVKVPLWELKLKDLQKDKEVLQSGKFEPDRLGRHRSGVTITPPSGNFNARIK